MTDSLLMYAILALDAYNEDPATAQLKVTLSNNQLGDATLLSNYTAFLPADYQSSGFYAAAYQWDGQTIISYRGTLTQILGTEINDGYGVGAGFAAGPQAIDAIQYFQNVATNVGGVVAGDWQAANIVLTGQSLGGGLAGYVGAIYGLKGVLFDNMTFTNAANLAYDALSKAYSTGTGNAAAWSSFFYGPGVPPYQPIFSNLSAYATTGELLEELLSLRSLQNPKVNYLNSYSGPANVINLHSQALLTLLIYAQDKNIAVPVGTDWQSVGRALYSAYFNDALGTAVGFKQGTTGEGAPASQMLSAIAYSALNSGNMPFGDTGIQSLFADADTLGRIQTASQFTGFMAPTTMLSSPSKAAAAMTPVGALAEIAVQFAGDQALAANTDPTLAQGALHSVDGTLIADLNPDDWTSTFGTTASTTTTRIVGVGDLFNAVLADVAAGMRPADPTHSWIASNAAGLSPSLLTRLNDITEVDIALGAVDLSAAGTPLAAYNGDPGGAMLIGAEGQGSITGSDDGNDIIVGGSTVTAGNGKDIILAGGTETITVGTGKNLILADSSSLNATVTYAGGAVGAPGGPGSGGESGGPPPATASEGTDVIIGNSAGGDTFTFTDAERAAFTVVWGGSGNDTFNINTSSSSNVNVVELDMSGISGGNLTNLDATKLENYVDQTYGLSSSQATLVILNPSTSDKISYNGKTVSTPASTLSSAFWVNDYSTVGAVPPYYLNAPPVDWSGTLIESGSFHALASANFAGAVAGLVGIECGVVSGVINLESSGVEASDWRPRHDEHYHEA